MALSKIQTSEMLDTPNLGRRNLIINGAMQVAQRGTSATGIGTTVAYNTVDRWRFADVNNPPARFTQTQSTDAPQGFGFSHKFEVTTADTGVDADEMQATDYFIEAQNCQHLKYGTSNAESFTLSFYVKCSVASTMGIRFKVSDGSDNYGTSYTINSVNTWERKSVTIPGHTTSAINNDNGQGLRIAFGLTAGTDYAGTNSTAWGNGKFMGTHTNTFVGTSGATWQITGVQLEAGDTATDFEHRSYAEELALCQRYTFIYEPMYYQAFPITGTGSNAAKWFPSFPAKMRVKPTLITKDVSSTIQGFNYSSGSSIAFQSFTLSEGGDLASHVIVTFDNTNGGIANGVFGHWRWIATPTGSYVGFDAEL